MLPLRSLVIFISFPTQDSLVLSVASLPAWAEELTFNSPFLFPLKTRQFIFHCTAFGSRRYRSD